MIRDQIFSASELPEGVVGFVAVSDPFFSGWGPCEGLTNRLIFPCDSREEIEILMQNIKDRGDMRYAKVFLYKKPRLRPGYLYQLKTKEVYPNWYQPNAFRKSEGGVA